MHLVQGPVQHAVPGRVRGQYQSGVYGRAAASTHVRHGGRHGRHRVRTVPSGDVPGRHIQRLLPELQVHSEITPWTHAKLTRARASTGYYASSNVGCSACNNLVSLSWTSGTDFSGQYAPWPGTSGTTNACPVACNAGYSVYTDKGLTTCPPCAFGQTSAAGATTCHPCVIPTNAYLLVIPLGFVGLQPILSSQLGGQCQW